MVNSGSSPTTRPVIGPHSQINDENACPIPSVCNNPQYSLKLIIKM